MLINRSACPVEPCLVDGALLLLAMLVQASEARPALRPVATRECPSRGLLVWKRPVQAGVHRLIVGLTGQAIGSSLYVVEEGVHVDCDRRMRVVHHHVCASKRIMRSTMTTSLNLFMDKFSQERQPELTLSHADNIRKHRVQVRVCTVDSSKVEMCRCGRCIYRLHLVKGLVAPPSCSLRTALSPSSPRQHQAPPRMMRSSLRVVLHSCSSLRFACFFALLTAPLTPPQSLHGDTVFELTPCQWRRTPRRPK